MSPLSHTVAYLVKELGRATVDDLEQRLSGRTRLQLRLALRQADMSGYIRLVQRGRALGYARGRAPSTYAWIKDPEPKNMHPQDDHKNARPINSAWELGTAPAMPGGWPPAGDGRECRPLGGWKE